MTHKEFYNEIKDALEACPEFNNFECEYGLTLGECENVECLHCRVLRAINSKDRDENRKEIMNDES